MTEAERELMLLLAVEVSMLLRSIGRNPMADKVVHWMEKIEMERLSPPPAAENDGD